MLLLPASSYRVTEFMQAAGRLEIDLVVGTNQQLVVESLAGNGVLSMNFSSVDSSVRKIVSHMKLYPVDAIVGVEESTTLIAAAVSRELGLAHNSPASVETSHNKYLFRQALKDAGFAGPEFTLVPFHAFESAAKASSYPCVLKPLGLSGSRGVIRANDTAQFISACKRIRRILEQTDGLAESLGKEILVESFIPGQEVAVEGMLTDGHLSVIALFDKPDSMDGPYFEETIYVTPSRLDVRIQQEIHQCVQSTCLALGLSRGPIHAELRINDSGYWMIELAARSIGGRCSRTLLLPDDSSLEELILKQAVGVSMPMPINGDMPMASGVMMIPIPMPGQLCSVTGVDAAKLINGITDIIIEVRIGEYLEPLPEGDRYLGFIFARATDPVTVIDTLKLAHNKLDFKIIRPDISPESSPGPGLNSINRLSGSVDC